MAERITSNRTLVGIPFYDGEDIDVLNACLENVNRCLNNLKIPVEIIVGINGPRVSQGQIPISYEINRSKFNADVKFIKTPPGLVNAVRTIGRYARERGYERIFLTDADISRFPRAFYNMWYEGDAPVVGASYAAYPLEVLIGAGIELTPQEITFMRIFEADKHPLVREFTNPYRPKKRLKGSLLLVDTRIINTMFGGQKITSDSRMNILLPDSYKQEVKTAAFMHFARISVEDHVRARLRHYRAAWSEGDLDRFSKRSLIYSPKIANQIAKAIVTEYPGATKQASDFLLQCALRYQVDRLCTAIVRGKQYQPPSLSSLNSVDLTREVCSFEEANQVMAAFFGQVDWGCFDEPVTHGKGITQKPFRIPIDLEPFLNNEFYRYLILSYLGLDEKAEV